MAGEDHGPWLTVSMVIFLAWSVLFFWVRLWSKLRVKTVGLDDWAVSLALALSVIHQALLYTAVNTGYGKPGSTVSEETLIRIEKLKYASHFFYIVPFACSRVASASFIKQIAQHGPHMKPARLLAYLSAVWGAVALLVAAIRPPYLSPWLAVDGKNTMFVRWIVVEAGGMVVEALLWALSIHLVWSLQMQRNRRVFIVAAFGVRLLLIPLTTMRLVFLAPSRNPDPNQTSIIAAIFTSGALQFSIISTSVTALKPFLTVFNQPMFAYGSGGVVGRSADSGDPYYKLEMFRRVDRKVEVSDDSANWRPDHGSAPPSITAQPGKAFTRARRVDHSGGSSRPYHGSANRPPRATLSSTCTDDAASIKSDASHGMIIQKTTEVSVRYENSPRML